MRELTYAQAGVEAVAEEMRKDPTHLLHVDRSDHAARSRSSASKRVRATPIAEGAP